MIIKETKPEREDVEYVHDFASSHNVKFYFVTEPLIGIPKVAWYIVEVDGVTGLYNNKGRYLYDIGNMDPSQVLCRIEERSFYNYLNYGPSRPLHIERPPAAGEGWARECLRVDDGNIVKFLMRHPKRTVQECESVMNNEGYKIDPTTGKVSVDETRKQF